MDAERIRTKIFEDGEIIFNYAEIKGNIVLRFVISNPKITDEQIVSLYPQIVSAELRLIDINIGYKINITNKRISQSIINCNVY